MTTPRPPSRPEASAPPTPVLVQEVGREHHRIALFDLLDTLAGPLDRPSVRRAARRGSIHLNGEAVDPWVTLEKGDLLEVYAELPVLQRDASAEGPAVLYEGEGLLVADKPSGMPFDAAGRHRGSRSAVERLAARTGGSRRPRPVHRLDKETSGLVVAAFGKARERELLEAFARGDARVEYLAAIRGAPPADEGVVDVPLGKPRRSHSTLAADPRHGTPCRTSYRVAERLRGFTVLTLRPEGGRSHQVRAHLAALGRPALCDASYGEDRVLLLSQLKLDYRPKRGRAERPLLARPALHARVVRYDGLEVVAPLPDDLDVLLRQLRRLRPLT